MRGETSLIVAHYMLKNTLKISIIHMLFPMKFSEAKQAQLLEKSAAYSMKMIA
jgi:hypothetical protein